MYFQTIVIKIYIFFCFTEWTDDLSLLSFYVLLVYFRFHDYDDGKVNNKRNIIKPTKKQ